MARNKNTNSNTAVLEQRPGKGVEMTPIEAEPGVVTELVSGEGDLENGDLEPDADGGGSDPSAQMSTVLIEVPVAPFDPAAHRSRLVTVRLSQRQADALKCVQLGLANQHARLAAGGHVDKQAQVVQWLLETLATAIEKSS